MDILVDFFVFQIHSLYKWDPRVNPSNLGMRRLTKPRSMADYEMKLQG